jgi:hypothetical protein
VGAEHGVNIIAAIVAIFGGRKFRRTLENFNRHCNYLLYYGIQAFGILPLRTSENIRHT